MTLGEDRVRLGFNPSSNTAVTDVKRQTAALIDQAQDLLAVLEHSDEGGEIVRCLKLAQTRYKEAAMWLVKALTAGV